MGIVKPALPMCGLDKQKAASGDAAFCKDQ